MAASPSPDPMMVLLLTRLLAELKPEETAHCTSARSMAGAKGGHGWEGGGGGVGGGGGAAGGGEGGCGGDGGAVQQWSQQPFQATAM